MRYSILVKPGSKQEGIVENADGSLIIRTHARAHDGEANTAIIKLLAKHFKTSKSQIKIIKGETSRHKIIEVLK